MKIQKKEVISFAREKAEVGRIASSKDSNRRRTHLQIELQPSPKNSSLIEIEANLKLIPRLGSPLVSR